MKYSALSFVLWVGMAGALQASCDLYDGSDGEASSTNILQETTDEFFSTSMADTTESSHDTLVRTCGMELKYFKPAASLLEAMGDVDDSIVLLKVMKRMESLDPSLLDTLVIAKGTLDDLEKHPYYISMPKKAPLNMCEEEENRFQQKLTQSAVTLQRLIEVISEKHNTVSSTH